MSRLSPFTWRTSYNTIMGLSIGLIMAAWFISPANSADQTGHEPVRPIYTNDGELALPKGYRNWIFVGTSLSPVYKSELPGGEARIGREEKNPGSFHNVYINPEAYGEYQKTGKFPDQTMLIMEVFSAGTKDKTGFLTGGRFEEKRVALEVAVKDKNRPGGDVPWAYYDFKIRENARPAASAKAFPKAKCYDCHLKHAGVDNVWVQFYPALRDKE